MDLIAIKPGRYGTRRLQAGDEFEADERFGKVWKLLGLAKDAPPKGIQQLRDAYHAATGRYPRANWSEDLLREKLAALRIDTRHMRASD